MSKPRVHRSKKYKDWYKSLSEKDQGIVDTRVDTYVEHGELLKSKSLDPKFGLYEFKWDSGLRVYYAFIEDSEGRPMLLLLGGNKNSQASDITEAKNIVLKAVTKIVEKKNKATKKAVVKKKGEKMSSHKTIKASKVKALKVDSIDLDSFDEYKSSVDLNNKGKLIKLLTQMFVAGDHDAFMELMELYIDHVGKRKISKKANIPEKTIYNFKDKKHKTSSENIFKMMKAISGKDTHARAG